MNAQVFAAANAEMPARRQAAGRPMTLVLSRTVRAGHERALENVLHRLAAEVRHWRFLYPGPGGEAGEGQP